MSFCVVAGSNRHGRSWQQLASYTAARSQSSRRSVHLQATLGHARDHLDTAGVQPALQHPASYPAWYLILLDTRVPVALVDR